MASASTRFRHMLANAMLIVLAVLLCNLPENSQALELNANQSSVDLTPHLSFSTGTSAKPKDMVVRFQKGGFSEDVAVSQFEANHAPERWAAIELTPSETVHGSVLVSVPLASEVDVYVVTNGTVQNVLSYSMFRAFDPTQHAGSRLVTSPLNLSQGESVLLLTHVKFGPFQSLQVQFEVEPEIVSQSLSDTAFLAAFYAFGIASLFIFLALFVALEDWIGLLYALLFFTGLLFLSFIDGLLFRFLYPAAPHLQQIVGFFLVFLLSGAGYALSAYGFATGEKHRARQVCTSLVVISGLGFLASLVSPGPYVAAFGNVLMIGMFGAVIFGTRAWEAGQIATQRLGGWLGVLSGAAIAALILLPLFGSKAQFFDIPQTAKAIYLVLLLATLLNFTAQVVVIRREHAQAVAAELAALEREVALNRELLETEQNYTRARDLAERSRRQLATASHDLRQPLMSLRMSVDSLASEIDPDTKGRLAEAFDYIASLSESYLEDATDQDGGEPSERDEPYAVSLIFETVHQMFREEAATKGVSLRAVHSSETTDVPAMALMRITSNLVTNAIKYTVAGGVLFGVRRRRGKLWLAVYDTGVGMTAGQIDEFSLEGVKGATSEGHGLGLAVCHELAAEHGLSLEAQSVPGQGTSFYVSLS